MALLGDMSNLREKFDKDTLSPHICSSYVVRFFQASIMGHMKNKNYRGLRLLETAPELIICYLQMILCSSAKLQLNAAKNLREFYLRMQQSLVNLLIIKSLQSPSLERLHSESRLR